jgi:hypothetical protein
VIEVVSVWKLYLLTIHAIRDSAVDILTGYGMDYRGVGVRFLQVVRTGVGAHPASYPVHTWDSFLGIKLQGREADHSPPASAEVKKIWIYISTPLYTFMA